MLKDYWVVKAKKAKDKAIDKELLRYWVGQNVHLSFSVRCYTLRHIKMWGDRT